MTEKRYTLEEAREEFKRRRCLEQGHEYEVAGLRTFAGHSYPQNLYCGRSWVVGEGTGGVCLGETVNGKEKWDL